MKVNESTNSASVPPPDDRTEGWKPIDGGKGGERFWNGTAWTAQTRETDVSTVLRIWHAFTAFARRGGPGHVAGLGLLFLLLIVVFVTAVFGLKWGQLFGGDDSDSTDEVEQSEAGEAVEQEPPPEQSEAGEPAEQEPESPDPAVADPPAAETPSGVEAADCVPRTYVGTMTVDFEGWPVGAAVTSDAKFVIDAGPHVDPSRPGCRSTADLVWLGSGTDSRFRHEVNPSGSFCSILLGNQGDAADIPLTWTPDGSGGGTLAGTLFVRGQVGWVLDFGGFPNTCPPVEDALQYAFPLELPVAGEFTATVSAGTLVGGGTFPDPRAFVFDGLAPSGGIGGRATYTVEVTASEVDG